MNTHNKVERVLSETEKHKKLKLIEKQKALYSNSIESEIKGLFYKASVMYNMHKNKLYMALGFHNWDDCAHKVFNLAHTYSYWLVGIGEGIAKRLPQYNSQEDAEVVILKSDIDKIIKGGLAKANIGAKDMKQLAAHSDLFGKFLDKASSCQTGEEAEIVFDQCAEMLIQMPDNDTLPTPKQIKQQPRKYREEFDVTVKDLLKRLEDLQIVFQYLHYSNRFRAGKTKKWNDVYFWLKLFSALIDEPVNGTVPTYTPATAREEKARLLKEKKNLSPILRRALQFEVDDVS